jgi:energy-coupling factor transporter ATP-binding protein EcfA2
MALQVFAQHFRGFKNIDIELGGVTFLVGDNSSGKTSILHLLDLVLNTELSMDMVINSDHHVDQRDIFSPYFEGRPVTIGFRATSGPRFMGKLVTANRDDKKFAYVNSATFFGKDWTISVRDRRGIPYLRLLEQAPPKTTAAMLSLHRAAHDFQRVEFPLRRRRINSDEVAYGIFNEFNAKSSNDDEVFDALYGAFALPHAAFLGPLRALPERYYKPVRKYSLTGSHFASLWLEMTPEIQAKVMEDVNNFGSESGLFDKLVIRHLVEAEIEAPLFIYVEKNGHNFTLDQVGIGVSQVIPILFQSSVFRATNENVVLLVQQPELHLHPKAQAALGTYMAACVKDGVRFVIETHSDFLIDRFRAHVRDEKIERRSKIIFCQNTTSGNISTEIAIDDQGALVRPPSVFREFFRREFARTLF